MGNLNGARTAYGVVLLCVATAIALPAQTFKTLHSFDYTDGANPEEALVQGTDGNFYGTTPSGGRGVGTVFKITPNGSLTTLYSFCPQYPCTDGSEPVAGLVQATDGSFYGATASGGANFSGTIFRITPTGTLTTLYSFCPQSGCTDGEAPTAALVQSTDGNLYGTTSEGGANNSCPSGCGTVFKITPSGTLTTLYSFCSQTGCTDGEDPEAALVRGTDGNFYGTTLQGGVNSFACEYGCGTVFKISPAGALTTLYRFCSQSGCPDGQWPEGVLIQATDGDFYGTTQQGGATADGTVFKITPSGALTTEQSFDGTDGAYPYAGLVQATDGNFYGTTYSGGTTNAGTIFKITPSGAVTTLHTFVGNDGILPKAALVQGTDGAFYGTASNGGTDDEGTVFSLSEGVAPGVSLSPTSLTFGPQGVQAPNVPQVVTLTNTGQAPLSITSISITGPNSGDFAQANNCPMSPNTLAAGDNCRITVYFFPVGAGTLNADVTVTDNAPGSPQNVALSGVGVSGKPGLAGPRR